MSKPDCSQIRHADPLAKDQIYGPEHFADEAAKRLEPIQAEDNSGLDGLIDAIRQQTAAIQQLADSNAALIQAMAEAEGMDDEDMEPPRYLDGSTLD